MVCNQRRTEAGAIHFFGLCTVFSTIIRKFVDYSFLPIGWKSDILLQNYEFGIHPIKCGLLLLLHEANTCFCSPISLRSPRPKKKTERAPPPRDFSAPCNYGTHRTVLPSLAQLMPPLQTCHYSLGVESPSLPPLLRNPSNVIRN